MTINRVYIFDIDDTLINTKACVKMVDNKGVVRAVLSSQKYNTRYSTSDLLYNHLTPDYSEFNSLEILKNEPKRSVFNILEELSAECPENVYIITAREAKAIIHEWLEECGVAIPLENIYTNELSPLPLGKWKAEKMMEIVSKYPAYKTYIRVWEDNEECRTNMKLQETSDLNITIMDIGDE